MSKPFIDTLAMYFVINPSLEMSPGKMAAQVGHGVGYIYDLVDS